MLAPLSLLLIHILYVLAASPQTLKGTSKIASAWYAGWHSEAVPLANISWSKYTHMAYAFAGTTPDVNTLSLEGSNEPLLPKFVSTAHSNGVKASLSIGGWAGSRYFSTNVANAENRTAFVKAVINLVKKYDLDGLDFDWEYPNSAGIGCNHFSANDTSNFISFLQLLRQDPIGSNLTLSAATFITPFLNADSQPSSKGALAPFAKVLDWITIMNYDIWGEFSLSHVVGPNAPLTDQCTPSSGFQEGSATSAIKNWTDAGIPSNQIVLGVPAYGRSFSVPSQSAVAGNGSLAWYPTFNVSGAPKGDTWDDPAGVVDACGVKSISPAGIWTFRGLIQGGYLDSNGLPKSGIDYRWDDCSQTPYVYNTTTQVMVSFDNAASYAAKGALVKASDLHGFAMWEAAGDFNDILLDSILNGTLNGVLTLEPSTASKSGSGSNSNGAAASTHITQSSRYITAFVGLLLIPLYVL